MDSAARPDSGETGETGDTDVETGETDSAVETGDTDTGDPPVPVPVDADEDGYFAVATGGDDCDDQDPRTHPGAAELCDYADRDCDGDPYAPGVCASPPAPEDAAWAAWQGIAENAGAFGRKVAIVGDFDGDGLPEPLVQCTGCDGRSDPGAFHGGAFLLRNPGAPLLATPSPDEVRAGWVGDETFLEQGDIAAAGDVDGDGYDDLAFTGSERGSIGWLGVQYGPWDAFSTCFAEGSRWFLARLRRLFLAGEPVEAALERSLVDYFGDSPADPADDFVDPAITVVAVWMAGRMGRIGALGGDVVRLRNGQEGLEFPVRSDRLHPLSSSGHSVLARVGDRTRRSEIAWTSFDPMGWTSLELVSVRFDETLGGVPIPETEEDPRVKAALGAAAYVAGIRVEVSDGLPSS